MTLSTSNCRTIRTRDAPSATRMLISLARCADRASSRLATFAHAMSSTKPTAPISARKINRIGPPFCRSLNVISIGVMPLFVVGYSSASLVVMDVNSASAWSRLTPGARRPNTWKLRALRSSGLTPGGRWTSGTQRSLLLGNCRPSGMTPMMVGRKPLTVTVRPMTDGSPA